MSERPALAYKIVNAAEWTAALVEGRYPGSAVDRADGYIHMSTEGQLAETARRHYAGKADLRLLSVDLAALGDAVAWEPSRGGDLFPHLYGPLPTSAVKREQPLSVAEDGTLSPLDTGL